MDFLLLLFMDFFHNIWILFSVYYILFSLSEKKYLILNKLSSLWYTNYVFLLIFLCHVAYILQSVLKTGFKLTFKKG